MDKKFLAEYSSREKAAHSKFLNNVIKQKTYAQYPDASRPGRLKNPIIQSEPHIYSLDNEKIWSQIPFAGSLIVSLPNLPENMCLNHNGFEPSDIPKLIDLAKETGKVKFTLQGDPLSYLGLDY